MKTIVNKTQLQANFLLGIAAFSTYFCMYAFRKPFAAATFEGQTLWGIDYKIVLVIAQVLGYALAKGLGIKFISEANPAHRAKNILYLVALAEGALLLFALVPSPYNFAFMFVNGLSLGMVYGLVFGYLEGRQVTELLGAGLAISFIVASGVVKSVGRWLVVSINISDEWMPFVTGLLFLPLLLLSVWQLNKTPEPSTEDKRQRTERVPMQAQERKAFLNEYGLGLIALIIIYVLLTIVRDVRDNFSVEIWQDLGNFDASVFANTEALIGLGITIFSGLLFLIKDHVWAFWVNHLAILLGSGLILVATFLFQHQQLSAFNWMTLMGLGIYLGYVPFNCMLFERLIAALRTKGNVGFLFYTADFCGYLGSVAILLIKNLNPIKISWLQFFIQFSAWIPVLSVFCILVSFLFFREKFRASKGFNVPLNGVSRV